MTPCYALPSLCSTNSSWAYGPLLDQGLADPNYPDVGVGAAKAIRELLPPLDPDTLSVIKPFAYVGLAAAIGGIIPEFIDSWQSPVAHSIGRTFFNVAKLYAAKKILGLNSGPSTRATLPRPPGSGRNAKSFSSSRTSTYTPLGMAAKRSVGKRVRKNVKRARKSRTTKSTDPMSGELSSVLSKGEQGYMREEGWYKLRNQKFYDTAYASWGSFALVPTIFTPADAYDMLTIPSVNNGGALIQSARTKFNVLVSRVRMAGLISAPVAEANTDVVIGTHCGYDRKFRIQLLLDTQCNGMYEAGTGNSGSPYIADAAVHTLGVRENLQNTGRWFVLADEIFIQHCHTNSTNYALPPSNYPETYTFCENVPVNFDIDLSANPLLVEYNSDLTGNTGGITTRRTNNLCWCAWAMYSGLDLTVATTAQFDMTWQRVYFTDV